ncbi:Somatostatin receptor type 5 [Orchesella cincta]|uniref:Somatostatin receptor type 5 n=1 Tax=Orchesella cincta TaxID=48709 RepID=A0A1D2M9M5_ORCCI|nr:Somatostatin receptor type 5 [Orchesella cincta]
MNLSVANVCMLISIIIFIATEHLGNWPFGNLLCKLYNIQSHIPNITYSLFQLALAVERYLTVGHPVIAGKWSKPLISNYLAGILWIVSFPLMVPVIMYAGTLDGTQLCTVDWPNSSTMRRNTQYILYLVIMDLAFHFQLFLLFAS